MKIRCYFRHFSFVHMCVVDDQILMSKTIDTDSVKCDRERALAAS